jgi:hypothetical protein
MNTLASHGIRLLRIRNVLIVQAPGPTHEIISECKCNT